MNVYGWTEVQTYSFKKAVLVVKLQKRSLTVICMLALWLF